MDRADFDSENTTPPNVGEDMEELAEMVGSDRDEMEAMMHQFLDGAEADLVDNPAVPPEDPMVFTLFYALPEEGEQDVSLFVGEAEDYIELGVTFSDEFYRPWLGKWRSNDDGEVFYPVDIADGGFPEYELDLDANPADLQEGKYDGESFESVRTLDVREKAAVERYVRDKKQVIQNYEAEEVPEKLEEPRNKLEESFSHLTN